MDTPKCSSNIQIRAQEFITHIPQLHVPHWEKSMWHDPDCQWVLQLGSNSWDQWNCHKSQAWALWTETCKYYEKISIYNEARDRFIKEIYICSSLGKPSLLLNSSSSFPSAWITRNYLLTQMFCSLNLDTWLGKGNSILWIRSQARLKETTEFQTHCTQFMNFHKPEKIV